MTMKKIIILFFALIFSVSFLAAQKKEDVKQKKTAKEVLQDLPDMLIAQPDAGPDSNASSVRTDGRNRRMGIRYSSSMVSSIVWDSSIPPTFNVIFAGSASLPLSLPLTTAARTAFSISRWEVTPTVLRNFLILVLSTSSFMAFLDLGRLTRIYKPRRKSIPA